MTTGKLNAMNIRYPPTVKPAFTAIFLHLPALPHAIFCVKNDSIQDIYNYSNKNNETKNSHHPPLLTP